MSQCRVPMPKCLQRQTPIIFELWALGLVGARPSELKKGADKGIDGRLFFHYDPNGDYEADRHLP